MFSSIGWGEIFLIVILGVIIIGPERLPGVIQDVRAAMYAARKAINNAKAELNGEFGEMGQEFEVLRGPINAAAEWGRLGPKAALTRAIFDGDDSAWDDFNPKKILDPALNDQAVAAQNQQAAQAAQPQPRASFDYSQIYPDVNATAQGNGAPTTGASASTAGDAAAAKKPDTPWEDVT